MICLLIFAASVYYVFTTHIGPNNLIVNKSKGLKSEGSDLLLSRIEWASEYQSRVNKLGLFLFYSVIISVILNKISVSETSGIILLQNIVVCFVMLLILDNFFSYHSFRFIPLNIKENVTLLRRRLGCKIKKLNKVNTLIKEDAWL